MTMLSRVAGVIAVSVLATGAAAASLREPPDRAEAVAAPAAVVSKQTFSRFATSQCPDSGTCTIDFGTVGRRHEYEIRFVTCYVVISNPNQTVLYWRFVAYQPGGDGYGTIELRPQFLGKTTTSVTYNATEQGLLIVPAGRTMVVSVSRDGTQSGGIPHVQCTISGVDSTLE